MAPHKALWLSNIGAEFKLGKHEIPEPGPGEVLLKLEASALNPLEWKIKQSGSYVVKKYPAIIGEDGAGVVQKVGDGVTNLVQGDRVCFQTLFGNDYATYQEYCLTDAELAIKIPPFLPFEEAASVATGFGPFAVATYAQQPHGLGFTPPFEEDGLDKYTDRPIVIVGGASSVGQYAIQLAKLSGFSPLITTASLHNKDFLISLGATHVLDRKLPDAVLKKQATEITNGTPITYIFDAVSVRESQQTALCLLAPEGTLAVVAQPQVNRGTKNILQVVGVLNFPQNRSLGVKFAIALEEWLEEERITPNRVEVLSGGLTGIAAGLTRIGKGEVSGKKLVVRPPDTPNY